MAKIFYSDFCKHCINFYLIRPDITEFNNEPDRLNWLCAKEVIEELDEKDFENIKLIYGSLRDGNRFRAAVDAITEGKEPETTRLWRLCRLIEKKIAKKRGLIG